MQKEKIDKLIAILEKEYPEAKTALIHSNPLEMLIATILSAQCTDKVVNSITPRLFKKYRTAKDYANTKLKDLESDINKINFYKNKARAIIGCCKKLVEDFKGVVPKTMDDLTKLPGVGRKTANVVLGQAFGIPSVVVDTHVKRVSYRLGLTKHSDPEKIEMDLMKLIPKNEWTFFTSSLIWHGRKLCKANAPICSECPLNKLCPSAFKV